jgi:uncharacterized protein YrrD
LESNPSNKSAGETQTIDVREGGHSVRRAVDLLGTKVVELGSGAVVGKIEDLLFDRSGQLQGFLLDKKYWFAKAPFLPISNTLIGEDIVTYKGQPELHAGDVSDEWVHLVKGDPHFKGIPVVTSKGKQLGLLEDVYFQEELGTIIGYELSDGFFSDLMEGRRMIPSPGKLLIGKDAFIIHQNEEK